MRTCVYILFHEIDRRDNSHKLIGVFDSESQARAAVERVKGQPGFLDHQDGFVIDRYTVNKVNWSEGFGVD